MKKSLRKMVGATLLEVMLVLAIAAMIIVMSIRYYQTAQANQSASTALSSLTAIVAAVDNLAQGSGSVSLSVSQGAISALMPTGGMTTPWGTNITVAGSSPNVATITFPGTPANVCPLIKSKLDANPRLASTSTCAQTGGTSLVITYDRNK